MDDQEQDNSSSRASHGSEAEPVRSRWTPKPEQILILESIFNSGMVNPPKDETAKIRKLLEKFGSVGDANVFYWFQNRRSRSRRRQRQIQASLTATAAGASQCEAIGAGFQVNNFWPGYESIPNTTTTLMGSGCASSSFGVGGSNEYLSFSGQGPGGGVHVQELDEQSSYFGPSEGCSGLHFQSAGVNSITVFINGVATEVGRGPLDMKAFFVGDFVLFHSSGVPVEVNEHGFLVQSLQHGESYFLVPRHS